MTQTSTTQQTEHKVFEEFKPDFEYHLKALICIYDTYDFNWLTTSGALYSFKRDSIETQNKIYYGFCKACKNCNIRSEAQLEHVRNTKYDLLEDKHINLSKYLGTAPKYKTFTKKTIKKYEDTLKIKDRLEWIKDNGVIINCLSKKSLPAYVEVQDLEKYFRECMIPKEFGFVDYYNGVILIDNINYNPINTVNKKIFKTDNYGRVKITTENKNTFYFLQFDKPNTLFRYWTGTSKNGETLKRLYPQDKNTNSTYKTKYIDVYYEDKINFKATPAIKIKSVCRREKLTKINRLTYKQL